MLKPSLQLKLGQTLTMTPQLQQAIRLLQLPVLDLNAQIQDALEENIMLEMEDLPDVPKTSDESTAEIETLQAEDQWQTRAERRIQDGGWNGEGRPISEFADESGETLREHLLWQLEMEHFSPREAMIGEAIIDAINDDGYLTIGLGEIEEILNPETGVHREEIEAALAKVQKFDPAGIGARSLSECITLQLQQLDSATPGLELAIDVANQYLDLVATRDYSELRRSSPYSRVATRSRWCFASSRASSRPGVSGFSCFSCNVMHSDNERAPMPAGSNRCTFASAVSISSSRTPVSGCRNSPISLSPIVR